MRHLLLTIAVVLGVSCGCSCRPRQNRDGQSPTAKSQEKQNIAAILTRATQSRKWKVGTVKIWLSNPAVIVRFRKQTSEIELHAWPASQNDFDVPMLRIDNGDFLYRISEAEYGFLEAKNEKDR